MRGNFFLVFNKLNSFILSLKKKRKINLDQGVIKVNIGSGLNVVNGWVNVDGNINLLFRFFPKILLRMIYRKTGVRKWFSEEYYISVLKNNQFIHHNVQYGLPFKDESVDFIYTSHLLEHLYRDEAYFLLKEFYRTLKRGGRVRIVVPDLEYVLNLFQNGNTEEALSYFFCDSNADIFSRHHYMYNFQLLSKILGEIGFVNIEKFEHKKGHIPDVELLDNRPKDSLHLEAIKPIL